MEKIIEVNSVELTLGESVREMEFVKIPKMLVVKELVDSYRFRLVEGYKELIFNNWDEQVNLDLTEELMREAVMIMDASEEEILKMFFEDAQDKYAEIEDKEYFNQLFEVSTKIP